MNKATASRTVETTNFAGGCAATARWTREQAVEAEAYIAETTALYLADDLDVNGYREDVQVWEYQLPGLRVTALVRNGSVETVFMISDDLAARMHLAVRRQRPVTITYDRGDGTQRVRTVEPRAVKTNRQGQVYMTTLERESGEHRAYTLAKVLAYTVHRTRFLVREPARAPHKADLAAAFAATH